MYKLIPTISNISPNQRHPKIGFCSFPYALTDKHLLNEFIRLSFIFTAI
ncbi:hypothetical protein FM106_14970 [Brachybacterium faecium]|nr:hypothetical protein FM106_14970 [Brachybacterium faecium]